jgi:hemoglobin-like flavoprotein
MGMLEVTRRMTPETRNRVQTSFAQAERLADIVILSFFQHLFSSAPELRGLFPGEIGAHGRKLFQILKFIVESLDEWPTLVPFLQSMGRRCARAGLRDESYPRVESALWQALEGNLGGAFGPAERQAWKTLATQLISTMTAAAGTMRAGGHQTTLLARPADPKA